MPTIDPASAPHVDGWVSGWGLSRETTAPIALEHGWRVLTRTSREHERYVLTSGDADAVCRLAGEVAQPATA